MTVYRRGQRVVLIRTNDPYTDLRPGDTGTVHHHDAQLNAVDIDWDNGSTLSMLLNDGDRIAPAPEPQDATPVVSAGQHPEPADRHAPGSGRPAADSDAVAHVTELPSCDIHRLTRDKVVPARYDGATRQGPWAYMCDGCFMTHGVGLGVGRGQRLILGRRPDTGAAADGSGPH